MKKKSNDKQSTCHISHEKKLRTVRITNKLGSHSIKSRTNIYMCVHKSIFYIAGKQERSCFSSFLFFKFLFFQVSCFLTFEPSYGSSPSCSSTPRSSFRRIFAIYALLCLQSILLCRLCFLGGLSGMGACWVFPVRMCEQHNNWYWPENKRSTSWKSVRLLHLLFLCTKTKP